jgi:hypothetical protein
MVEVQWDATHVRLLEKGTGRLPREHTPGETLGSTSIWPHGSPGIRSCDPQAVPAGRTCESGTIPFQLDDGKPASALPIVRLLDCRPAIRSRESCRLFTESVDGVQLLAPPRLVLKGRIGKSSRIQICWRRWRGHGLKRDW